MSDAPLTDEQRDSLISKLTEQCATATFERDDARLALREVRAELVEAYREIAELKKAGAPEGLPFA